jgi:hypothetical protein
VVLLASKQPSDILPIGAISEIRFRDYAVGDPPRIIAWYKADREGFESFMGQAIPDELACTLTMNSLFHAVQQGLALFAMVDHGEETIGFTGLTNVSPDRTFGQPHLYIAPPARRYSVRVAKAAERHVANLGVKHFMASVERDNRRGLALMKRLGFQEVQRKAFLKEISA